MRRIAALAFACSAFIAAAADAPALPPSAAAEVRNAAPLGNHRFRYIGFHVYDASLWTVAGRHDLDAAYSLDIRYAMEVRGRDLARRSIDEMRGQGHEDEVRLARWLAEMERVFPDIRPGDRLVGVHVPGVGARFHSQRGPMGEILDPAFARAFFDIWLGERTSQPAMRRKLLGLDSR